jgi:hypothetical protein
MNEVDLWMQAIRAGVSTAQPYPWMRALRSHCEMLAEMGPQMISAISLTTSLAGDSVEEVEAVRRASESLAGEFGFTATTHVNGRSVSVRFARSEAVEDEIPGTRARSA